MGSLLLPPALLLMCALFALPSVVPQRTDAFVFGAESVKELWLDFNEANLAAAEEDGRPREQVEELRWEHEQLLITQGDDEVARLEALERLYAHEVEQQESDTANDLDRTPKWLLLRRLVDLGSPETYATTADEPALYRAAEIAGTAPPLLLYVPAVAVAYAVLTAGGAPRALSQAPARRRASLLASVLLSAAASVALLAAAALPAMALQALRAGVGDPSYPVVFVQAGELVDLRLWQVLLRQLGLYALVALLAASLSAALRELSGTPAAGALACVAAGLAPTLPGYLDTNFALAPVLAWLPTTYLDLAPAAGWPHCLNLEDAMPVEGYSWGRGALVLAACSAALRGRLAAGRG